MVEKAKAGDAVSVNYKGTLDNGSQFDSSYDRNQTLDFTIGAGQMIKGFDDAIIGMGVGEKKKISLKPDQAYGEKDPARILSVESSKFDNFEALQKGMQINGGGAIGIVVEKGDSSAKVDFNHPLAGQNLNFEIELVSINK